MATTTIDGNVQLTIYDLGVFRFGDYEIYCDSFKTSFKIKADTVNVTSQTTGAGYKLSEEEYSWEASDVIDPDGILKKRWKIQKSDKYGLTISTYDFVKGGDLIEKDVLYACFITDYDDEKSGGDKVTVKGTALRLKD